MALYYYLISSLPDLSTDGEIPIKYDEFLAMCQSNISDQKYEYLKDFTLDSDEGPVFKEWGEFYYNLKSELNHQRSAILGKPYKKEYDKDQMNTMIVQNALNARNPLEAEMMLLNYQFEAIDSIIGLHVFDDTYLFGYAIKLKLLERRNSFVKDRGKQEFDKLLSTVQEKVYNL